LSVWASISTDAIKPVVLMPNKFIIFTGINIINVSTFDHHGSRKKNSVKVTLNLLLKKHSLFQHFYYKFAIFMLFVTEASILK
jgi:hypothetical protein